jgi:SAM-dependent methyltransferase
MTDDRAPAPAGMTELPDYGLDAPGAVRGSLAAGLVLTATGIVARRLPGATRRFLRLGVWVGAPLLVYAGAHWSASRHGKRRLARHLLDQRAWSGHENVLDVGCGRGLLLVEAATRAPRGAATGVDVWSQKDLGDNRPDATLANARAEGVNERVVVLTADAASLPFDDASFDLVTSSFALHNLHDRRRRRRAIGEIARVLRPSGQVLLADIFRVAEYERAFVEEGFEVDRLRTPLLNFLPFRSITGTRRPAS